jgi:integrase
VRGSVRKRGETWTWYLWVPDPLTGKLRQRSKGGFPTKKACQAALGDALADLRKGTFVEPSKRTVGHFLTEEWLPAVQAQGRRPGTVANYRIHVEAHVVPALGGIELQQLSPAHLNAFYLGLLRQGRRDGRAMAPKTVRNVHNLVHRALRDAVRWGFVGRNVADAANPPAGKSPEPSIWTPAELGAFIEHVRDDRLYAAWMLFATTGMRRSEVAGLRIVDLDLDAARVNPRMPRVLVDHQVVVSEPKTRAGRRSLALDPATLAALQDHLVVQAAERALVGPGYVDSGLLFTWPDGRPINPARFSAWFEQHISAARLPRITLHGLRHSYATAALKAGVPVKIISERLGHATVAITLDVYSHVIPGMDELAATTVAGLILGDAPANRTLDRPIDKPVTSKPSSSERRKEVEARRSRSEVVSEGGLEPPPP